MTPVTEARSMVSYQDYEDFIRNRKFLRARLFATDKNKVPGFTKKQATRAR